MAREFDYHHSLSRTDPDEERREPDHEARLALALLGVELAQKDQEAIRLERHSVSERSDSGALDQEIAELQLGLLEERYLAVGQELWEQQEKAAHFGLEGARSLELRANADVEPILTLSKRYDDPGCMRNEVGRKQQKARERQKNVWRNEAIAYYHTGTTPDYENWRIFERGQVWCQIRGKLVSDRDVEAATIVPIHFLSDAPSSYAPSIGAAVFGCYAESVVHPGNALLMPRLVKRFFDKLEMVIVPVDASETPINRWRCEFMCPDFVLEHMCQLHHGLHSCMRHGKELAFFNEKRPVPRFLYLHFIMALAHIKDLRRPGWKDVWARYHQRPPFPTPCAYMRKSIILALVTHFDTVVDEMPMLESWIAGNGLEVPLWPLTDAESVEMARRLHEAVKIRKLDEQRHIQSLNYETDDETDSESD
ncbi:hypothetical protein B0T25DRAFT_445247 [Lasiosphaeria hispida]|uniref:HNH nuclease domain-containing protein n=1 Tax=Lasiosphaeria hispida TaxID=260671 RepID=A0AAJ0HWB5_9PEZI|nr:hypothetical protein B0T25DRAFT_445247 [Lasiosphaeria hispida]